MSLYKYLYGKKKFLMPIIEGNGIIRFNNIKEYSNYANQKIRDDEFYKKLHLDYSTSRNVKLIGGNEIREYYFNPGDEAELKFIPIICYSKCFSNKAFSEDMFHKFESDICLKINIEKLAEATIAIFKHNYPDIVFNWVHNDITYFDKFSDHDSFNGKISSLDFAFLSQNHF
ncbi:hypothetical protein [Spirochaeta isovalerica]|uniref:Uncharacterized protein n=1 Tax=Spirochaeta isovalerica TaxID=150 RepID=A0A841RJM8_9SPIO|nr:hypothetical protein [Spirochaeta isovalerica]MBB6482698.1 hypothetical protein [Spirochaeta isovalerica]